MRAGQAMRSREEIENLIRDWEALRVDYMARGSAGIVSFIDTEIRKLRAELASAPQSETEAG